MSIDEIRQRNLHASVVQELTWVGDKPLWWLSFVDPDIAATVPPEEFRPGGPSFLGVAIVEAAGEIGAVRQAHAVGANPGGQVAIAGPFARDTWDRSYWNRTLTAAEVESMEGGA